VQAAEENCDLVALGSGERTRLVSAKVLDCGALHGWISSRKAICPFTVQTAVYP
jgi:hypothetical protein